MQPFLADLIGATDIYLLDQIMKERYQAGCTVLDAGCGGGRNLHWFLQQPMNVYGIDADAAAIDELQKLHPLLPADRFRVAPVEASAFGDDFFDHVISSAVLHFATGPAHFFAMLHEMLRVLKVGGTLFIRMATDIGIEGLVQPVENGVYLLPDGSHRFLLTRALLRQMQDGLPITFMEPFKSVNVADMRAMCTMMLQKL